MVSEGDLIWGDEHTIQYTDNVCHNCTLKTGIIVLTDVTAINLTKQRNKQTN